MLIRVLSDNSVVVIEGNYDEAEFLEMNKTGGFRAVASLPTSASGKWKLVGDSIVSDADADAEIEANMYKLARAAEYPPIADYIDGLVKGDQAQIDSYLDACRAVKAKHPKP